MIIATSSLKEAIEIPSGDSRLDACQRLFKKHYSRAMSELTKFYQVPPTHIILISCLLFIACESFQGSTKDGLIHVNSGLQIIREWNNTRYQNRCHHTDINDLIMDHIEPIFAQLRDQRTIYGVPQRTGWWPPEDVQQQSWQLSGTDKFKDLFAARDSLFLTLQQFFRPQAEHLGSPSPGHLENLHVAARLRSWHRSFEPLRKTLKDSHSLEARTADGLSVHGQILSIHLESSKSPTEVRWDNYLERFRTILDQCSSIIKRQPKGPSNEWTDYDQRMCLFEHDFGLIAPLFTIASCCRDPELRRQAVQLMRYLHRQEGSWDSCSAAKLAEGIIKIEERHMPSVNSQKDVSESNRIRAHMAEMGQPGEVILTFSRSPYISQEKEAIDWATWSKPQLDSVTNWVSISDFTLHSSPNTDPVHDSHLQKSSSTAVTRASFVQHREYVSAKRTLRKTAIL
jgi:hypothetical protein